MTALLQQESEYRPKYIVNHDIMNCTAEGVVANHLYSGRALGITESEDILQLHPLLKPLWVDISAHYSRVGLSHTDQAVWNLKGKSLFNLPGYEPSVFFYGTKEYSQWQDSSWFEVVEFINSKNNFMSLADDLGVDVPVTRCYNSVTEINVSAVDNLRFPCYLKAAISVSGVGIYRCEDEKEFKYAIRQFSSDVPVQIQEEVKTDTFLNLQYQVIGNSLRRLAASEQILDGCVHQGNRVPASHEPWSIVEPMAIWLMEKGIKGIFAFDVAVLQTESGLRFPAIECNPRFNGASYPTLIAEKLGIYEWSAISLSTQYRTLKDIDLSGIEFSPEAGEGVVLVNWGTVLEGKLMVLIAGTKEKQGEIELALRNRL